MGEVYAAFDRMQGEAIALKTLRPELAADERARERFLSEAKISRQLSHPHILRVFDGHWDGNQYFLTMQLLEGRTLRAAMRAQPDWLVTDVLKLAKELGSALEYAHGFTIHRDIKPENIWIESDGSVKLMDFGLARTLGASRYTRTGFAIGTVDYMAPEQRSSGDFDHRVDQYALAVVLYELLTGKLPIGRFSSLHALRQDAPESISHALDRALSPNPEDRFPGVAAFVSALTDVTGDTELLETPASSSRTTSAPRTAKPPRLGCTVTIALLSVLVVSGVSLNLRPRSADDSGPRAGGGFDYTGDRGASGPQGDSSGGGFDSVSDAWAVAEAHVDAGGFQQGSSGDEEFAAQVRTWRLRFRQTRNVATRLTPRPGRFTASTAPDTGTRPWSKEVLEADVLVEEAETLIGAQAYEEAIDKYAEASEKLCVWGKASGHSDELCRPSEPSPEFARIPASHVLAVAYGAFPPKPPAGTTSVDLQLQTFVRHGSEGAFTVMKRDEELTAQADAYVIVARANSAGYFYVFQVDTRGHKQWLFPKNPQTPTSAGVNPIPAGEFLQVPDREVIQTLDPSDDAGVNHVYTVFSVTPWLELERALAESPTPGTLSPPITTITEPNGLGIRGIRNFRPPPEYVNAAIHFEGESFSVPIGRAHMMAEGHFLVVENWFPLVHAPPHSPSDTAQTD